MDFLKELFMTAESGSGDKFPIVLLLMAAGTAVAAVLALLEHKIAKKGLVWLLLGLNALVLTGLVFAQMALGAGLSEVLLLLLVYLLVRLIFIMTERRSRA